MKSDTCPRGGEQWERFYSKLAGGWRIQYDYRALDGRLFSCVTKTIEAARNKRDAWLAKKSEAPNA